MKHRNLLRTFLLSVFTLGIYYVYWLARTRREMLFLGARGVPSVWILFAPLLVIVASFVAYGIGNTLLAINHTPHATIALVLDVTPMHRAAAQSEGDETLFSDDDSPQTAEPYDSAEDMFGTELESENYQTAVPEDGAENLFAEPSPAKKALDISLMLIGVLATLAALVVPFAWFWRYSSAVASITAGRTSRNFVFWMWVLTTIVGLPVVWQLIVQNQFNKLVTYPR